jgi:inosose dehydratase
VAVRFGFAPITWNNEDLRDELGPPVAFETVLDEVAEAGYQATELGDGFPREPRILRDALDARGLTLTSAWCALAPVDASIDNLDEVSRLCDLLAGVGASFVNLAYPITSERSTWAGRAQAPEAPRLPERAWDVLATRVCRAAEVARDRGLQAAFHPHAGTWIETEPDVLDLLRRTDPDLVKLCWDVGHAVYGGMDPVRTVREHPERVAYLHLKDVNGDVLEELCRKGLSFEDGIRCRVFTELGSGVLDVPGLLAALDDVGYDGWCMVEQDSTWLAPIESARKSRGYLRSLGV